MAAWHQHSCCVADSWPTTEIQYMTTSTRVPKSPSKTPTKWDGEIFKNYKYYYKYQWRPLCGGERIPANTQTAAGSILAFESIFVWYFAQIKQKLILKTILYFPNIQFTSGNSSFFTELIRQLDLFSPCQFEKEWTLPYRNKVTPLL